MEGSRRPRRSTEQVRGAILEAAAHEFAQVGYEEAKLRSIADRAAVGMSVLYRHFPSKEALFTSTLLAPLLGFLVDFSASWRRQALKPWTDERIVTQFAEDLLVNLDHHRSALVRLVAASDGADAGLLDELRPALAATLAEIELVATRESARRPDVDAERLSELLVLSIAMLTGLILMRPLLPPGTFGSKTPVAPEVVDLAARYMLRGITI